MPSKFLDAHVNREHMMGITMRYIIIINCHNCSR